MVSLAQAPRPSALAPGQALHDTSAGVLPEPLAVWEGRALPHYVLGEVAHEQNHNELVRAGIAVGETCQRCS